MNYFFLIINYNIDFTNLRKITKKNLLYKQWYLHQKVKDVYISSYVYQKFFWIFFQLFK